MSDKKNTSSKKPNSYSLLLKGLNEVQKKKPPKGSTTKKSQASFKRSVTPENTMSSQNKSENSGNAKPEKSQDPDVPDRSYGDYFCKLCDSHMNSDNMWEAHITGKRHIKNVKKGDTDSKYEDLPDVESSIKYELRNVKDPIVGLSYIHEIRRKEPNVPPIYNCFLCHASIATVPLVTEHVISMKHRLNYIKENNPDEYQLIEATNLKKGHMEPLVEEAARKMELELGRGTVKVKQEKKKSPVYTYSAKKTFNIDDSGDDDDNKYHKSRKSRYDDNSSNLWKTADAERNLGQWEKRRSPRDFEDTVRSFGQWEKSSNLKSVEDNYRNRSRSRSPRDFKERKRIPYSDEERSMDSYKKAYSKRDVSPRSDDYDRHKSFSKREISPKHDYRHLKSTDDYLQSSRKIDSFDRSHLKSTNDYLQPSRKIDSFDRSPLKSTNDYLQPSRKIDSFDRSHLKSTDDYLQPSRKIDLLDRSYLKTTDDYLQPSKKIDSRDRSNYITPHHEHASNKTFNNRESADSFPPKDNLLVSLEKPAAKQSKTVDDVFKDTLLLSSEDCYWLFCQRLQLLPEISNINEILAITKLISEAQKKLREKLSGQLITTLLKCQKLDNPTNVIPGLSDSASSSAEPSNIRTDNSNKSIDAERFISDIFKSANYSPVSRTPTSQEKTSFSHSLSTSFAPPISCHQTFESQTPTNYQAPSPSNYQAPSPANYQAPSASYQPPPVNYQAPPVNSFQGTSTSSYPNQAAYQQPNTNMQYSSSSGTNYSSNIPPCPGDKTISQSQVYNYSHFSSLSSSPSKNFPRKY